MKLERAYTSFFFLIVNKRSGEKVISERRKFVAVEMHLLKWHKVYLSNDWRGKYGKKGKKGVNLDSWRLLNSTR